MIDFIFAVGWVLACGLLAGVCDRIRGGWKGPGGVFTTVRKVPRLFEGLIFMFMSSALAPLIGPAAFIWALPFAAAGASLGYQQDNGWRGQFVESNMGYDEDDVHKWYEPMRFGAWQGLLILPLVLWGPAYFSYFIYAVIIGQIVAMASSMSLFETHIEEGRLMNITNAWPGSEFLGPVFTTIFWALFIYLGGLI